MKATINTYTQRAYRVLAGGALITLIGFTGLKAQLNPLAGQYYNNQYLGNPAMAGIEKGLELNAAYRKQWANMPGGPEVQNLTMAYGFKKVGLGLNIVNDKAGLQRQTRVVGTYAYHVALNNAHELHFGVSLGFMNQRLENSDINGNPNDVVVGQYNDRKTYLDGDFGVAYTNGRLTLQGALPNLKTVFKKDQVKVADVATFYGAASYKIPLSKELQGMNLEPKVAYRGVQGFQNILDVGAMLSVANEQVSLTGLYHSTQSGTLGIGLNLQKKYLISGLYTTQTSALNGYSNGNFELNLRVRLGKK
jgi:type IX secretion system PorP/SprF family membrane protein